MSLDIKTKYKEFNRETIKLLEAYCIGHVFDDHTDVIAENIREYVVKNFSNWLLIELEAEFRLFCQTPNGSISVYIIGRLFQLLKVDSIFDYYSRSLLSFFVKIQLMQYLALKIEAELEARPHVKYPVGVSNRANWNIVMPAYAILKSFISTNCILMDWTFFKSKDKLVFLNKTFYCPSKDVCFWRDALNEIERTPDIPRPDAANFKNKKKLIDYTENATFALYFK
jgi:hypothetical protein